MEETEKNVVLDIVYEETFQPTEHTPVKVVLSKEKFSELSKKYGIYGIDWYFVEPNLIKFFDKEWDYQKVFPEKVITEKEWREKEKLKEVL